MPGEGGGIVNLKVMWGSAEEERGGRETTVCLGRRWRALLKWHQ